MSTFWWWFAFAGSFALMVAGIALIVWACTVKRPCACGCHAKLVHREKRLAGWIVGGLLICTGFGLFGMTVVHAHTVCAPREATCT